MRGRQPGVRPSKTNRLSIFVAHFSRGDRRVASGPHRSRHAVLPPGVDETLRTQAPLFEAGPSLATDTPGVTSTSAPPG